MSDAKADAIDQPPSYRVGVDIGGTFTDLILVETTSGAITVGKSLTTPVDPSEAVETVLRDALGRSGVTAARVEHIIHGTTLVTNSLIERKGSKTALLTTKGFRDAVEIGREHRYDLYDIFLEMPKPLVPRYLRLEVDERVLANGEVVRPPDLEDLEPLVREAPGEGHRGDRGQPAAQLRQPDPRASGGGSDREDGPEHPSLDLVRRRARDPRVRADQHDLRQRLRPGPGLQYLRELEQRLRTLGFGGQLFVMLSSGGIGTIETATRFPIRLLESGPVCRRPGNSLLRPDDRRGRPDVVRHGRDHGQAVRGREGPAADGQQQYVGRWCFVLYWLSCVAVGGQRLALLDHAQLGRQGPAHVERHPVVGRADRLAEVGCCSAQQQQDRAT